jgi:hypothetical protein
VTPREKLTDRENNAYRLW